MSVETPEKEHLNLVVVGHIDAGKSTTCGHLMYKLKGLSQREYEKLEQEAKTLGKESFSFAFYMDKQKEERARGVTISCSTKEFYTNNYHFTIIDAPGHRDFIKNMISGASQADVAILMVPANKGGFETSIQKGNHKGVIQGQTRQHAQLCYLLGIEQIIVGINKMDDPSVNYSEDRYNEIKDNVYKMLSSLGYKSKMKSIPFIPMSGFKGENLDKQSDKMPWYKGFECVVKKKIVKGYTLVDALENVVTVPKRPINKPFRMPVSSILKIKGVGDVVTGKVEQGLLKPGVAVKFIPTGCTGKVFSIEMHHKSVNQAGPGDNVGLNIKNLPKELFPKTGDVMHIIDDPLDKNPPKSVKKFTAQVFVQSHPGQLKCADNNGKGGFTPSIHVRTAKVPCRLLKIHWKKGKSTGKQKVNNPSFLSSNDSAEVEFEPKMPFYVENFKDCPGLGRIAVMDSNSLIMLGMITHVDY